MDGSSKYSMLVSVGEELTGIEVGGIGDPDDFLEFLDKLTSALPLFIVEFIRERVADEYQESLVRDTLMKFVLIYLEKAGVKIPGFNELLGAEMPTPDSTVH